MLKVEGVCKKFLLTISLIIILSNDQVLETVAGSELQLAGWDCSDTDDKFICDNQVECIPGSWRCNGFANCDYGEDELNCSGINCADSLLYVPEHLVCNGYSNCADSSDEINCHCLLSQRHCISGLPECVSEEKFCDRVADCQDGSDEQGCSCNNFQFECGMYTNFSNQCVDAVRVCDGVNDCMDGSDEDVGRCGTSCAHRCTSGSTYLGLTPCISSAQLCDNVAHCGDHSDESETNCTGCTERCIAALGDATTNTLPLFDCLYNDHICDGIRHCLDNSDESGNRCGCSYGSIQCTKTGICFSPDSECNGINDCGDERDWQDECYCDYSGYTVNVCGSMCLAPWQLCDGVGDCEDNSDELWCDTITNNCDHHPNGTFSCLSPRDGIKECIQVSLACNGNVDCHDGSDESLCDQQCASDETRCATGVSTLPNSTPCVPNSMWCDGVAQCLDLSDETYEMCYGTCTYHPRLPVTRCPSMADASTFICVTLNNACNRIDDCQGGVDEGDCCNHDEFRCADTGRCITGSWICDGVGDCDDGSDEHSCSPCPDYHFQCLNDLCIPNRYYCDGYYDCGDGSDERWGCAPLPPIDCAADLFKCLNIDECIPLSEVCDGSTNCNDGSDELTSVCSNRTKYAVASTPASESEPPPKDQTWKIIVGSVGVGVFGLIVGISAAVAVKSMTKGRNKRRVRGVPTNTTTTHAKYNTRYGVSNNYTRPSTFPKPATTTTAPVTTYPTRPPSVDGRPASTTSQLTNSKLSNKTETAGSLVATNIDSGLTPVETPSAPPAGLESSGDLPDPPSYDTLYQGSVDPEPIQPAQPSEVGEQKS